MTNFFCWKKISFGKTLEESLKSATKKDAEKHQWDTCKDEQESEKMSGE